MFYISSDDQGELWLSTDDNPANKKLVCSEPQWNGSRVWTGGDRRNPAAPENISNPIGLEAGKFYYVEALMKEGVGGDNLAVAWKTSGQTAPPANGSDPISAPNIAGFGNPGGVGLSIFEH